MLGSFRSWVGLRTETVSVTMTLGHISLTAVLEGELLVFRATDFVAAEGSVDSERTPRGAGADRTTAPAAAALTSPA